MVQPMRVEAAYDVAVIGAGVVGCAVARELARHRGLRVALVEAADDVGQGTSKANTAILHTGFDASPGSLESRLVARGHTLLSRYGDEVAVPVEAVGALLVAWNPDEVAALPALADKAARNGHRDIRPLSADELYRREPRLGPGALGGIEVPGESIICPWTTTLAFATQAVRAGVHLRLRTRVTGSTRVEGMHRLETDSGSLSARYVVNAAGLAADVIDRWFGGDGFTVLPRRGQLMVFDKPARALVAHILLPVPTRLGKGVLVAPTVYGNVLLGPTAEDLPGHGDTASTAAGLDYLRSQGGRILPALLHEEVTAVYAGVRAATEHSDYQLRVDARTGYVCVGGIRSTGLTASMAIAEEVVGLLTEAGLDPGVLGDLDPLTMPNLGEARPRPYQRNDLISADPQYGRMVCHCERVSRAEIRDALAATVPATTLEGLRRRTRALTGRCQGFYCAAEVSALLADGPGADPAGSR